MKIGIEKLRAIILEQLQQPQILTEGADPHMTKAVQAALNIVGISELTIGKLLKVDGDYGKNTENVVMEFQRNYIPGEDSVDGKVGPVTAAVLQDEVRKVAAEKAPAVGERKPGIPGDKSTGRRPIDRKDVRSPEEFGQDQEAVAAVIDVASDKSAFKDPVMAGAALGSILDNEGEVALVNALEDMAGPNQGRRAKVRAKMMQDNIKKVLARTSPSVMKRAKEKHLQRLKNLSFGVYKRTGIGVFEPRYASLDIPGPTAELKLDEAVSGDPNWTVDATMRILQMIRDKRAVLSR
jgi:peptidoglycan hydrolase-like protein with peptidoglycan-binding domain